jgi:uncharacterized membrane protein YuzA (DUF378 family)
MFFLNTIALILILIGALNWGLIGLFDYNLVEALLGQTMAANIIYIVVGFAGLWGLSFLVKCKALCGCRSKGDKSDKGGCCRK